MRHAKFALLWLSTIHTKSRIEKLAIWCIDKQGKGDEAELHEMMMQTPNVLVCINSVQFHDCSLSCFLCHCNRAWSL